MKGIFDISKKWRFKIFRTSAESRASDPWAVICLPLLFEIECHGMIDHNQIAMTNITQPMAATWL